MAISIQLFHCGLVKSSSAGVLPVKGKCFRQAARYASFSVAPATTGSTFSTGESTVSTPFVNAYENGRSLHT